MCPGKRGSRGSVEEVHANCDCLVWSCPRWPGAHTTAPERQLRIAVADARSTTIEAASAGVDDTGQLAVTVALLAALGLVANRFGLSAIPAYLLAGLLLGPNEPKVLT
jgi:hypothetical protein